MADQAYPMRSRVRPAAASRTTSSAAARVRRACASTRVPAAVRVTSLVVRRSSLTPSAVSSEASVRDAAAWEMPRSIAASVKLPASAMATRQRSCRSSTLITKVYR